LKIDIKEDGGIGNIQRAELRFVQDGQVWHQSETYIYFDKDQLVHVVDPYGYLADTDLKILEKNQYNLIFDFEFSFAKANGLSGFILKSTDIYGNTAEKQYLDMIQIVESGPIQQSEIISETESEITSQIETEVQQELVAPNKPQIPIWVKNNANWWSENQIDDSNFVAGIDYLITQKIVIIPESETSSGAELTKDIPGWVKANAGWWGQGLITDDDFVQGMQWLISNGMMGI